MLLNQLHHIFKFSVRVRYAPSPTGPMHLGAVRTALFNYMFAKHNKGKFIVRMEDTDLERNIPGSMEDILNTLDWLGISPDQSVRVGGKYGPYIQSQRLKLYKQKQNELLMKGFAYPCFCQTTNSQKSKKGKKKEEIQEQGGQQLGYDGKCRKLSVQEVKQKINKGEKYAIRIKSDIKQLQFTDFKDQLYGNISIVPFDDFVLVKKNGYPTYHFANVIDDWQMKITHVIRGVEWLSNTFKHIYLYKIFALNPPTFMHLPLIYTSDGKKLSKRDPTAPIANLKSKGYQPEAIINYAGQMGFTPEKQQKNEENQQKQQKKQIKKVQKQFFSLYELYSLFQLNKLNNSPIRSDIKKLNFFNRYYMRKKWKQQDPEFINQVFSHFRTQFQLKQSQKEYNQQFLNQVVQCIIERVNNFQDFNQYDYFFKRSNLNTQIALKDIKKMFGPNTTILQKNGMLNIQNSKPEQLQKYRKILHNLRLIFMHVIGPEQYTEQKIAQNISKFLSDSKELSNEDVYHILRLAVTGKKSGVNIIKTCYFLGRERICEDLRYFGDAIQAGSDIC